MTTTMTTNTLPRIEMQGVGKRYAPALPLSVKNVDLKVAPGEFCVFVGPSGCGKSTLLRMVAGLETVTEGELRIDGRRVNDVPPAQRGVAMVFQSYALYPHMTVYENMAFGLRVNGAPQADVDRKVREAARILQVEPLLDRKPKALSGGQRQRVAIGRAIVKQPKVFLFDEPLSNLDAALRAQTRVEIARLHREVGSASMIYVTHDQVEAMTLAEKIVLLHAGERIATHGSVAQVGSPMTLYHRPATRFVAEFIGSPSINVLPAVLGSAGTELAELAVLGATGGLGVKAKACVDARHLATGTPVSLAVRPEHLRLGVVEGAAVLTGRVTHLEQLGDSALVYLGVADDDTPALREDRTLGEDRVLTLREDRMLTLRVEGHAHVRVGENVRVSLLPQALHLFDGEGNACERTVELPR